MRLVIYMATVLWLLLAACGSVRSGKSTETHESKKDSVRIEYREKTVFVPDTVFIEIPAQNAERTTSDTVSYLENDFAESHASITLTGRLFHDLRTKPNKRPFLVKKEIIYRDSIQYRDRTEKGIKRVRETVEVEKKLNRFQKGQMYGFWVLLVLLVIKYRNTIKTIARRLFLR